MRGKICAAKKPRQFTMPPRQAVRWRVCWIRNDQTSSLNRSPTSCRAKECKITISYVETLKYEDGSYEFVFPMVVGPRYIPGSPTASPPARGNGFSNDTDSVPDASRITPEPVPAGMRVGNDISLDITLDAGVAIDSIGSKSHAIEMERSVCREPACI